MKAKHMIKFLENFAHHRQDDEMVALLLSEVPGEPEEGAIRTYVKKDGKTFKGYTLTYKIDENDVIYLREEVIEDVAEEELKRNEGTNNEDK